MEPKHTQRPKYSDIINALTTIQDNTTALEFFMTKRESMELMGILNGECKFDNSLPKSQLQWFYDEAYGKSPKA